MIILFSRPIRTGKTTELRDWCRRRPGACGLLMPDLHGTRMFEDVASGNTWVADCEEGESSCLEVGRFRFSAAAFGKACNLLLAMENRKPPVLVVDEAGKLELAGKGLFPALSILTDIYSGPYNDRLLLIVVRDRLLQSLTEYFGWEGSLVVPDLSGL